jgi:hypothetical protein
MSHLVAITRWGTPFEQELAPLAALLRIAPYDLRLRLAGPIPVVIAGQLDAESATRLTETLRGRGHGAVACDLDRLVASESMDSPRDFSLEGATLRTRDPGQGERSLACAGLEAMLRAALVQDLEATTATTTKKFSAGRALATGGLVRSKKVSKESRSFSSEREELLYVFPAPPQKPLLLRELRLHYLGLGPVLAPTTSENFQSLVVILRQRAPQAFYDERLALHPRKRSTLTVTGSLGDKLAAVSNQAENDLAAHLLLEAHRQDQL